MIRTVEVHPPSRSNEAFWVAGAGALVVLVAIYSIGYRTSAGQDAPERSAYPFQVLFADLPPARQRVYRELQEGFGEALRVRAASGRWPAVGSLAAEGIPPFAPSAVDRGHQQWQLRKDGLVINYLGLSAAAGGTDYLLLVQEPEPQAGEQLVPGVVDEEHQLLPGGQLLHVTYWLRAAKSAPEGVLNRPETVGWSQIRSGTKEPVN